MKMLFLFVLMSSILMAARHGAQQPALQRRRPKR
jgi:hypothetical protein